MKRVFAHIGFSSLITLIILNVSGLKFAVCSAGVLFVLLLISVCVKKTRSAGALPIVVSAALFSCIVFCVFYSSSYAEQSKLHMQKCNVQFEIIDLPEQKNGFYYYTAKSNYIDKKSAVQNIKFRIKSEKPISAEPYDRINAELTFYKTGENSLDSKGYFANNIYLTSKLSSIDSVTAVKNKPPFYHVLMIRQKIINTFTGALNGDNGALALALLIGDKSYLSNEAYSNFKSAGVTHLMAVSGLHTSLWGMGLLYLFKKLKISDKISAPVIIFILFIFAGLASFSKSVIRSLIMISVILISRAVSRRADSLNSLGLAVFIICLNPFAAVDLSTLLSVSAALGIIIGNSRAVNRVKKHEIKNKTLNYMLEKVISSLTVTLCVFIATMPVMFLFFGSVNIISFISNIVMVPLGMLTMVLSASFFVLSGVPFIGIILCCTVGLMSEAMLRLAESFSEFFITSISMNTSSSGIVIGIFLIVLGIFFAFRGEKHFKKTVCAALAASIFVCGFVVYYNKDKVYVSVYSVDSPAVLIQDGNNAIIVGTGNESAYYSIKNEIEKTNSAVSLLLVPNKNEKSCEYSGMLSIDCNTVNFCMPVFDNNLYSSSDAENFCVENAIDGCFTQSVYIHYEYDPKSDEFLLIVNVNGVTIAFTDGISCSYSEITVDYSNEKVYINSNEISFDETIIFEIAENSYNVRRENLWLG